MTCRTQPAVLGDEPDGRRQRERAGPQGAGGPQRGAPKRLRLFTSGEGFGSFFFIFLLYVFLYCLNFWKNNARVSFLSLGKKRAVFIL